VFVEVDDTDAASAEALATKIQQTLSSSSNSKLAQSLLEWVVNINDLKGQEK